MPVRSGSALSAGESRLSYETIVSSAAEVSPVYASSKGGLFFWCFNISDF